MFLIKRSEYYSRSHKFFLVKCMSMKLGYNTIYVPSNLNHLESHETLWLPKHQSNLINATFFHTFFNF